MRTIRENSKEEVMTDAPETSSGAKASERISVNKSSHASH